MSTEEQLWAARIQIAELHIALADTNAKLYSRLREDAVNELAKIQQTKGLKND